MSTTRSSSARTELVPQTLSAASDLWNGLLRWQVYGRLGWLDTKRRYRRTVLGPFWSAVSLAIMVASLGIIGVGLWQQKAADYVPFLAAGMMVWLLIQTIITESCGLFIQNQPLIRQMRIEYSVLAYSLIWRNMIAFAHNFIVYTIVMMLFAPSNLGPTLLLAPVGLAIVAINAMWIALLLGIACLKYRDLQQLIANLVQVAIFVTPIFWPPDRLQSAGRVIFVTLNPIFHLIEVVRMPLIGQVPTFETYCALVVITALGWSVTYWVFSATRSKIPYWS